MDNFTWNIDEIKQKLKYVKQRLKNETNPKEKEMLTSSLLVYINMINSSDVKNMKFTKVVDILTHGKFSLIKNEKYKKISDVVFGFKDYVYDDDLLLELSQNLKADASNAEELPLNHLELSPQQLIEISKGFYKWLGDEEIYNYACKMLDNTSHLQIENTTYYDHYFTFSGVTYSDMLFDEVYISMSREFTLFDAQVLNHEIMHSIDFTMNKKLPSNNYYGFHEVPTYTIDYLFFDYLEETGYDINEINKLRLQKTKYIESLASYSLFQLRLNSKFDLKTQLNERLKKVMDKYIRKNLLEVQSELIARSLYSQIKDNKINGINNLKKFMRTNLPTDKVPDFSYIGISKQDLLDISKTFGDNVEISQDVLHSNLKSR